MSDTTYCDLDGWTPDSLGQYFGTPTRPKLKYFGIKPHIAPWTINDIDKCGEDIGWFQTMISEEGVPYHQGFGEHMEVGPSWAHSHYLNERADMALEAVDRDGKIVLHPAGVIGWSHPDPKTIKNIQDLYDRTDRANAARTEDMPKIRANLHNYAWTDPDSGKVRNFIIACGWVLPSVTRREVIEIENAGISGVSTVVSTVGGVGVEMITADIVRQGRMTSGTLARPNLDAATACSMEVFEFEAADIARILPDELKGPDMAIEETIEFDLSAAKSEVDALAAAFEARVDAKVAEAKAELGIVDPPPPPTAEQRMEALEGDLARRADSAQAPDFAAIGDSALSTLINNQQRDTEDREDFHNRLAKAAKVAPDTIRQYLASGRFGIWCPPREALQGLATEFNMGLDTLIAAARKHPKCGDRYGS